jgi:hypothetical protein
MAMPVAAQITDQSFELVPEVTHATVGDPVSLRFRVRLDERDLLYDTVPKPVGDLPAGVRVLSVERLRRGPDRIYTGRAQVAFYRTGRQAVPVFGLPFMRGVKGMMRGLLASDSAFVTIEAVAPAGNPPLKDIKGIEHQAHPDLRLLGGLLVAAVAWAIIALSRRRRPAPAEPPGQPALRLEPYHAALARLTEIEQEGWPDRGEVDRHYAAVADTLRRYLEEAQGVLALRCTTSELLRALPPRLTAADLKEHCAVLLREADRVKFARARPEADAATRFVRDARSLLDDWHARADRSLLSEAGQNA